MNTPNIYDRIEMASGVVYHTGCLVPDVKPQTFACYADEAPMLTMEQIGEVLSDPKRIAGRQRFGVNWIFNQGSIGSCNIAAASRMLMRQRNMRGQLFVELSTEFGYSLINGGSDRGSMLDDGMALLMNTGLCRQELVPRGTYKKSRIPAEAYEDAKRFKAWECYRVDTESELASGLALGFTGVVAVQAGNGGIDSGGVSKWGNGRGNHAVGVDNVRIIDGNYQFDMPNSWGTNWGDNGRAWLTWSRHFRTTQNYHAFYLIRGATDDPQGLNPPLPKG